MVRFKKKEAASMVIHTKPIDWYVEKLKKEEHYSIAGYSDAEWFSILGISIGKATGLGQILERKTGDRLAEVLQRRKSDPSFMFAVPDCFWDYQPLMRTGRRINSYMRSHNLSEIEFYERDVVTDYLARDAGLYPFIKQLQQMHTVLIGPKELKSPEMDFLGTGCTISISSPNLHREEKGIEEAVRQAQDYGIPGVYLISAGMSAALIIDQLHGTIPDSWFIDCASIWDAFVGIGLQRSWRKELYKDPEAVKEWKRKNIYGT